METAARAMEGKSLASIVSFDAIAPPLDAWFTICLTPRLPSVSTV